MTEAQSLLLDWNSGYDQSCAEKTHFLHLFQVNLRKINYFCLFISFHLLIRCNPGISINSDYSCQRFEFVFLVIVKTMSSVQSLPIIFTKYFWKERPREKNEGTLSHQSGDAMYTYINFTKYKSCCRLVFFKKAVLEIFEEN